MTFIEFIGLIITLAAMIFLSVKRSKEKRQLSREEEEELEHKHEEMMQALLGVEKRRRAPPPPPEEEEEEAVLPHEQVAKHHLAPPISKAELPKHHLASKVKQHHLLPVIPKKMMVLKVDEWGQRKKKVVSKGSHVLHALHRTKDMVILHTLFSSPKALQKPQDFP